MQHLRSFVFNEGMNRGVVRFKMETHGSDESIHHSYFNSVIEDGLFHRQLETLTFPEGYSLSSTKSFKSLDGKLLVTVFSFLPSLPPTGQNKSIPAAPLLKYAEEVQCGRYATDPMVPSYNEAVFSRTSLEDYIHRSPLSYITGACNPRRFLLQRQMYHEIHDSEGTAVHVEPVRNEFGNGVGDSDSTQQQQQQWITVATASVTPEELCRLSTMILTTRRLHISRTFVDVIANSGDSATTDSVGSSSSVVMLRMRVVSLVSV
jgi:hypothetical protein